MRDIKHSTSISLQDLPKGFNSTLILLKLDSASETDAAEAIRALYNKNIDSLDVVIASAGIARLAPVADLPISEVLEHVQVNVLGPLRLFQATLPLLQKAETPKFVVMGSDTGSVATVDKFPYPNAAYGASKAMLNSLVRKIGLENDWLLSLTVHPG